MSHKSCSPPSFFLALATQIRRALDSWSSEELPKLMHAFMYRLYEWDHFPDMTYVAREERVEHTVHISAVSRRAPVQNSHGFVPPHARSQFDTRTHVLWNPNPALGSMANI